MAGDVEENRPGAPEREPGGFRPGGDSGFEVPSDIEEEPAEEA